MNSEVLQGSALGPMVLHIHKCSGKGVSSKVARFVDDSYAKCQRPGQTAKNYRRIWHDWSEWVTKVANEVQCI